MKRLDVMSGIHRSLAPRTPPTRPKSSKPRQPVPASGQAPQRPLPQPRPVAGGGNPRVAPERKPPPRRPVIPAKPASTAPVPPPRKAAPGTVTAPGLLPAVSGAQGKRLDASTLPALPARPSRLENVQSITGILANLTSVAGALYPVGSRFPDTNTVVLPDGVVVDKQAQAATHPNGAVQYADGTILHPEGIRQYPNGDIENPDGSWRKQDGPIFYPDAGGQERWLHRDGIVTDAEGKELGMIDPSQAAALFGVAS